MAKDELAALGKNTQYEFDKPSPSILETFENKHPEVIHLVTFSMERDEFTSLCPVTGQPDQAKIEIIYVPGLKMVESKSLKLYLFSFRNSGEFHENVVNRIIKDLFKLMHPKYIRVFGDFASRGGIAIKPLVDMWNSKNHHETIIRIKDYVKMWDRKR